MTKKKETFDEVLEAKKPNNIYYKLSLVKKEIGVLSKNAKNPFFKSDYLDLNGILSAVEPLLDKYGLLLLQPCLNGKVWTKIVDIESENEVQSYIDMTPNNNPQAMGSQISYFRRYGLVSLLAIQQQDDDGNHASKPTPKLLNKERFDGALCSIQSGDYTVSQLIKDFDLDTTQMEIVNNL